MSTIIQVKQMLSDKTAPSFSRSHSSSKQDSCQHCLPFDNQDKKMDSNILFFKMQRTV